VTVEPRRIRLDPALPYEIGADGTVSQNDSPVGRLRIVQPSPDAQPARREGAYFRMDSSQLMSLSPAKYQIRQGHLERSNFAPHEASIKLIGVLRQFESLQRALQLGGEMGRKAVDEVARVAP